MLAGAFARIPESSFRVHAGDFSRTGPLSPEFLTVFLLYMVADSNTRGIRHLVPDFWNEAVDHGLPLPCETPVTPSAICQARQKLNSDLLRDLLSEIAWGAPGGQELGDRYWRGRRVLAVDGAKVNLRKHPDLAWAFGVPEGAYCPQVLLSLMVDACTRMPMDLQVSGYATSERDHLFRMLESLQAGDILLLDRGYPSHEVLQELAGSNIDYVVRVPASHTFKVVDEFRESGAQDAMYILDVPKDADAGWKPLLVRLVRVEGPDGPAFYITSMSPANLSIQDIAELYHLRWQAEEAFKLFTSEYIGQGQFRSTSPSGVIQEFHALALFLAIARVLACVAEEQLPDKAQFPSQKGAVLTLANFLTRILLDPDPRRVVGHLERAITRILRTRDLHRPDRSYPRRSFRPQRKWGPSGRRGA